MQAWGRQHGGFASSHALMQWMSHAQLAAIDEALRGLRPVAMDVLHLLGYVSLNMAALRKILKKYAKNVAPNKPQPGEPC